MFGMKSKRLKAIESLHEKSEVICSIAFDLQDAVEAYDFTKDDMQEIHYAMFRNKLDEDIASFTDNLRAFSNQDENDHDSEVAALYMVTVRNMAQAEESSKAIKKILLETLK